MARAHRHGWLGGGCIKHVRHRGNRGARKKGGKEVGYQFHRLAPAKQLNRFGFVHDCSGRCSIERGFDVAGRISRLLGADFDRCTSLSKPCEKTPALTSENWTIE